MHRRSQRFTGWYTAFFLHDLVPIYPFYAVMFTENGVGPYGLSVLLSVWVGFCMIMDIPTGALADRVSRKRLLVACNLFQAAGYLVWLAFPHFMGFLAGFLLWGTACVLKSGTTEALLFDTLAETDQTESFTKIYGRLVALGSLSGGLAMVLGGYFVRFGFDTVLALSVMSSVLAALAVQLAIRDASRTGEAHAGGYLSTLRQGLHEAATNPSVLYIVALSGTLLSLPGLLDEYVGPLLDEKGFANEWIGYLFGAVFVAQSLGNAVAHRLNRFSMGGMFAALFCAGVVLLVAGLLNGAYVAASLIVFFFLFATAGPTVAARLQESIQGAARATVTSVGGAVECVASLVILQCFGIVSVGNGMSGGTLFIAGLVLTLCPVFAAAGYRLRVGGKSDIEARTTT